MSVSFHLPYLIHHPFSPHPSMAASPSSPNPSMPLFCLLTDSDEEGRRPKRKIFGGSFSPDKDVFPSFHKGIVSIRSFNGDEDVLPSDSSDTDPSWNYQKKYHGGDHLPDGVEWSSDLEREEGESEDESITTKEIREMTSDTEILFAEPVESPSKLQRFRHRVLKAKGTSRSGGKGSTEESPSKAESTSCVGKNSVAINGKEEKDKD